MTPELTGALMIGVRYVVCLLAPLIPAVLIFKLFPDSKISLSGPLQGLSVKSGGAFAAYLITFLIALPMTSGISDFHDALLRPVWTVEAKVMIIDKDARKLPLKQFADELTAVVTPKLLRVGRTVRLHVPITGKDLPLVLLEIPGFGAETIDLSSEEFERDEVNKKLILKDAVIIREASQYTH
jgi:hypothetical protein